MRVHTELMLLHVFAGVATTVLASTVGPDEWQKFLRRHLPGAAASAQEIFPFYLARVFARKSCHNVCHHQRTTMCAVRAAQCAG